MTNPGVRSTSLIAVIAASCLISIPVYAENNETDGYTFEDLSKYSYEFCSGAGGWSTDFNIEKDGYFHGSYHDSDMGSTGEGYENGTLYSSDFSGHFSDLNEIDEYTYEMVLSDISYAEEVGTEEIIDQVKYIYSEAYGLCGTDRFLVYLPGTPVSVFDEEISFWIQYSIGEDDLLTTPVIVNEDQQEGMYSYERLSAAEEAQIGFDAMKSSYDAWMEKYTAAETTTEMRNCADQGYQEADDCLNDLWKLIKYNTDEETFQMILEEELAWLEERDAQAEESKAAYEDGTLAEVAYLNTMGTLTLERCEELLEYIK